MPLKPHFKNWNIFLSLFIITNVLWVLIWYSMKVSVIIMSYSCPVWITETDGQTDMHRFYKWKIYLIWNYKNMSVLNKSRSSLQRCHGLAYIVRNGEMIDGWWIANDFDWSVCVLTAVLPCHLPETSQDNYENQSEYPKSRLRCELSTSRIWF
jgi:hypothetical protein